MTCGRRWEIQAIDEGRLGPEDVAAFQRHSAICPSCLEEARALGDLRALAADLRVPVPRELDLRRLRARILRDAMRASSSPPRRALLGALAVAVVATAALAFALPRHEARIPPSDPSPKAEPSPVATDSEKVREVAVEPRETDPMPATAASPPPVLPHAAPPTSRPLPPPKSGTAVGVEDRFDAEMADYQRAVDEYRLGRFTEASSLLRAFVERYPTSTVLDDAWFIEASSLASAGLPNEAAEVAEAHLAHFPASFHRKQAAILVARGHRDRGDCVGARAALAPWSGEPSTLSELGRCNR